MEQYLWMAFASVALGFFVKTYWDVYTAYRAYMTALPVTAQDELVSPSARPAAVKTSAIEWLLAKGDRLLHAMLMSPVSR